MNEIVPAAAHDMSFLSLFLQADPIVKSVMILLVLASLGCWTIIFEKLLRIRSIRRQARAFEAAARSGGKRHPQMGGATGRIVAAGHEAWRDQDASESRAERRERIERAMRAALSVDMRQLQVGLPFLATTGSAAPFIGLFGTVWGIMNSFIGISEAHTTNLAVVAPGIAEALLATALGLVAAIPAVVIYNHLTRTIAAHRALLGDASAMVLLLISREGDRGAFRLARAAE
jgi:biopolymer transport protein TolQ